VNGGALLLHGGGPTQVMNASLAGVVEECRQSPVVKALYGARHGIEGALAEDFYDLAGQPAGRIDAVARTPGSALGSSRWPASAADYERLLEILDRRGIRFLFFTGGNGSMYMAHQIALAGAGRGLRVIGIPKTIDNDIGGTDHTPGYGSTAWFFACAARDIGEDIRALRGRVTMLEVMGRNAGWLTAATVFSRSRPDDPPHLIYLPERPLSRARFLSDVEAMFRKHGVVVAAVCEGQTDESGRPMGDLGTPDGFDRRLSGNLAHTLARLVIDELGLNARSEKPGLLGRSSMAFISETDRREAYLCGRAAVRAAVEGHTGMMISLERAAGPEYGVTAGLVPLEQVGFVERLFPLEWITPDGAGIEPAFLDYAGPLLGPMQYHARLAGPG
jgi:6-phosphofructokinase